MKIQDGPDIYCYGYIFWNCFNNIFVTHRCRTIGQQNNSSRVLTKRVYTYCIAGVWITSTLITMITTMPEFFRNSILASISRLILASFTVLCLIGICSLHRMMYVYSRLGNPRIRRDKREQNKSLAETLFIITMLTFITWIPLVVATVSPLRYDHCVTPTSLFDIPSVGRRLSANFLELQCVSNCN